MKELTQLLPFSKEIEFVHLPEARVIGRATRSGGPLGNRAPALWDAVLNSDDRAVLEALPCLRSRDLFGWTCEYDPPTDTFVYLVCALTPSGTPVPEGFQFRDISETVCAVGLYGETVNRTVKRVSALGYETNWGSLGCGWNAELTFAEEEQSPPKKSGTPWHWLVPIRKTR